VSDPSPVTVRWTTVERVPARDVETRLRAEDRRRAAAFGSAAARAAFVVGRALRDDVLACWTGMKPADLRFRSGPRGKPRLAPDGRLDVAFNVSHSHGVVAVAVARTSDLGLDVEALRNLRAAPRLARRFLAAAERDAVLARSGHARNRTFLTVWTRKEAWLKATGRGLSVRLATVEVEPDPDRPPRLLSLPEECGAAGDWSLLAVPLPVDAVATACLPRGDWSLDVAEWRPSDP
jgi:4'-phosphopantetheinyl transferase